MTTVKISYPMKLDKNCNNIFKTKLSAIIHEFAHLQEERRNTLDPNKSTQNAKLTEGSTTGRLSMSHNAKKYPEPIL